MQNRLLCSSSFHPFVVVLFIVNWVSWYSSLLNHVGVSIRVAAQVLPSFTTTTTSGLDLTDSSTSTTAPTDIATTTTGSPTSSTTVGLTTTTSTTASTSWRKVGKGIWEDQIGGVLWSDGNNDVGEVGIVGGDDVKGGGSQLAWGYGPTDKKETANHIYDNYHHYHYPNGYYQMNDLSDTTSHHSKKDFTTINNYHDKQQHSSSKGGKDSWKSSKSHEKGTWGKEEVDLWSNKQHYETPAFLPPTPTNDNMKEVRVEECEKGSLRRGNECVRKTTQTPRIICPGSFEYDQYSSVCVMHYSPDPKQCPPNFELRCGVEAQSPSSLDALSDHLASSMSASVSSLSSSRVPWTPIKYRAYDKHSDYAKYRNAVVVKDGETFHGRGKVGGGRRLVISHLSSSPHGNRDGNNHFRSKPQPEQPSSSSSSFNTDCKCVRLHIQARSFACPPNSRPSSSSAGGRVCVLSIPAEGFWSCPTGFREAASHPPRGSCWREETLSGQCWCSRGGKLKKGSGGGEDVCEMEEDICRTDRGDTVAPADGEERMSSGGQLNYQIDDSQCLNALKKFVADNRRTLRQVGTRTKDLSTVEDMKKAFESLRESPSITSSEIQAVDEQCNYSNYNNNEVYPPSSFSPYYLVPTDATTSYAMSAPQVDYSSAALPAATVLSVSPSVSSPYPSLLQADSQAAASLYSSQYSVASSSASSPSTSSSRLRSSCIRKHVYPLECFCPDGTRAAQPLPVYPLLQRYNPKRGGGGGKVGEEEGRGNRTRRLGVQQMMRHHVQVVDELFLREDTTNRQQHVREEIGEETKAVVFDCIKREERKADWNCKNGKPPGSRHGGGGADGSCYGEREVTAAERCPSGYLDTCDELLTDVCRCVREEVKERQAKCDEGDSQGKRNSVEGGDMRHMCRKEMNPIYKCEQGALLESKAQCEIEHISAPLISTRLVPIPTPPPPPHHIHSSSSLKSHHVDGSHVQKVKAAVHQAKNKKNSGGRLKSLFW
eukprot:GHVS01012858.1.p1 GENE.GHVS01012858.1~~GHVS01012858.1.p1  ORF type:complete len:994 (-),score=215.92 GHVS01012858.1:219-3200(-)